jgi:predicted alpha/beta superfamily hydrolase
MALTLRVRYPAKGRPISLRTDADWGRDLGPVELGEDGNLHCFRIERDDPYVEFKLCLTEPDGTVRWNSGSNYVATAAVRATHDVYPAFRDTKGRISDPVEVAGAFGFEKHRIRAYVPPGHDENPFKRFPVVYMHDGSNLFFPGESFLGATWNVQGTLDALDSMNVIDPVIVVAIEPRDRMSEYTSEGNEAYARYIVETVKPVADQRGHTLPGPEHTVVMGSSLGGLVSLHLAWSRPDVFGGAACLSSTFAFDDELFRRVAAEPKKPIRIYLDSGHPKDNFEATLAMRNLLLRKGYRWGQDLLHFVHPGARHHETAWAVRLHLPFQYFFGRGPTYG